MKGLSRYLSGTRIGRPGLPGEEARLLYGSAVKNLRQIVSKVTDVACDVAIVHTLNRYSEICRIGDSKVLIYDRYAGQLLNAMTRILYWSSDRRTGDRLFSKLFAEQSILAGDWAGAMIGTGLHIQLQEFWTIPKASSDADVARKVQLQEVFVFAHEYCHAMMASSEAFRQSTREVGEILLQPRSTPRDRVSYRHFEQRYPGKQSFRDWKKSGDDDEAFVQRNKDLLRDELGCDDFALHATLMVCLKLGAPPDFAFEAAFLALRNIRALAYIRREANPRSSKLGSAAAIEERLLQVRQHRLRDAFRPVASMYGVETDLDTFWSRLQDLSDLHDRQIDNPLLFASLRRFKAQRRSLLKSTRVPERTDVFDVAKMLGWEPDTPDVEFIMI